MEFIVGVAVGYGIKWAWDKYGSEYFFPTK